MCGVHYTQESVLHRHHKARGPPKRHKSRLLASHDERATTIEPAAYPVPLSSLSTRRVCSTTGRVYSTVTTKRKDPQTVTSPRLLASHDTRVMRGNQQRIQSLCRSCQPGGCALCRGCQCGGCALCRRCQPRGCAVQPGEFIPPSPQSARTRKPSQVPVCLLPMIRGRREGTSSVSSPFVVAVNPEDVPFVVAVNPEDVPFVVAVNPEDVPFVVAVNQEDVQTTGRVYSTVTTKRKDPQTVTSPRLLASHDTRVTTREPAADPVPLSLLSTRRMCSTTGRVYSTATTKLEDPKTSQVPSACIP